MIGTIISNYKIISVIGEGGMGIVYLAEHIHLKRKAAIKSLHKKLLSNNHIKERFKNEAATLSQIQHPNIVKLYDYIETPDGLYLIMEYVEGVMLDDFIKRESGPIKEENAVKIMIGLLSGFAYAHSKNIVHRDVKPSNVIISRDFSVIKILDFGIAKILDDNSKNMTKDGTQMGTVYYMSPEQVKGVKLDYRSDIYSLGVTFFQMVTGLNPYEQITSEYEIYNMITQTDLPKVKSVYPYVSDKIENIIKKATRKNVADRYQSCNQIIADLNHTQQPVVEVKYTPKPPPPQQIPPPPLKQQELPAEKSEGNGKLIASLIIGFLLLGLLLFVIISLTKHDTNEAVTEEATEVTTDVVNNGIPTTNDVVVDSAAVVAEEVEGNVSYVTNTPIENGVDNTFYYTGDYSNKTANGFGTAIYNNGDKYEGYFVNGLREGKGKYTWKDGESFDGQFKSNNRNGFGTFFDKYGNKDESLTGIYVDGELK